MKALRSSLPLLAALLAQAIAADAAAYCRTTTCDTKSSSDTSTDDCRKDSQGCTIEGIPIAWKDTCLTYGVQVDGSSLRHITPQQVEPLMKKAFETWSNAPCPKGGTPPITAQSVGLVECRQPEFNCQGGDYNTNTVIFRDDQWPLEYSDTALAITTVTVDTRTGEILDADIEINSKTFPFSLGNTNVNNDLLSVLTHEVGHFLGLAHSPLKAATMYASYDTHSTDIRTIKSDDISGICSIYSPEIDDPECQSELDTALDCLPDTACLGGSITCSIEPRCGEKQKGSAPACAFEPGKKASSGNALLALLFGGSLIALRRQQSGRSAS